MVNFVGLINIVVDRASEEPLYEQIRRQVVELVASGLLPAGARMPPVRQLAHSLGISKNTAALAYEELAGQRVIVTRHGAGTFVCAQPEILSGVDLNRGHELVHRHYEPVAMDWDPYLFPTEFFRMPVPPQHQELLRFTQANPDPSLFPFDRIKQVTTNLLWHPQKAFFEIGNPQGYQPLVEHLEMEMALAGVEMGEGRNDIIITGGYQRAVSLLADFILRPGQKVALESPSYINLLNMLIARRIEYVPIPVDEEGMDTDVLARELAKGGIHLIFATPTFHNPTGACMSQARKEHLLQLCSKYHVPVIEDDWARQLRYEGPDTLPLKAIDEAGYVLHVGSYSKCFLPGLRIGWITCPAKISLPLVRAKMGADRGDNIIPHALVFEMIQKGHFARHLRKVCKEYKLRRDAMCSTLSEHLPPGCRFNIPLGGLSIWLELPKEIYSLPLLKLARAAGVDFTPAAFMTADRKDAPALRLAFSMNSCEAIETGVKKLCAVIANCIAQPELLAGLNSAYNGLYQ